MQYLSIVRFELATKFGRAIGSACIHFLSYSLLATHCSPLPASPLQSAAATPNGSITPTPPGSDGFAKPQLSSTFTDTRTGQVYGRYIIYETVPVVAYQHQEVTEQQWVPEWVTEEKLMAKTNYIPVVSYQLQLQTERSMNPFVQPRQFWQYVPIVQYQPNFTQVKQPVTYQKYVQKEVKKSIPVLVSQSQPRAKFVDMPLQGNGINAAGTPQVAGGASVHPPVPTRPLDYPTYPSSAIVVAPPAAYYPASGGTMGVAPSASALAAYPAYNPQYSGWSATNPWLLARQYSAPTVAKNVNNPVANGGMPPGTYSVPTGMPPSTYSTPAGMPPVNYTAALAAPPTIRWPQVMSQTGALFQSEFFKSNSSNALYGAANPGTTYLASSPSPMGGGVIPPPYGTTANAYNANGSSGAYFIPRADTSATTNPSSSWSMVPVDNYRDPSQSGMPASVLR